MLKLFLSFIGFFNFASTISVNSSYMNKYVDYLKHFQKDFNYDNFLTFKKNVKMIEKHNAENNSYDLEINHLSDQVISFTNILYQPSNTTYQGETFNTTLPVSIDWREKDIITNVKNQGHCGSCWSFSATGAIEAVHALSTGNLLNITEQQLIDCSDTYGNQGCNGGSMDNAFKYVIDNGLCSENEYPYIGESGECQTCKSVVNISDYKD